MTMAHCLKDNTFGLCEGTEDTLASRAMASKSLCSHQGCWDRIPCGSL